MIQQKDNFFWYKLNGLLRNFIVRGGCSLFFKHITVNEYPKSGGTWIGQMISEATDLPFPRNRLPVFRASIMHDHYYSTIGIKKPLIVWRDGRDVVVSQYYHWLFGTEIGGNSQVQLYRNDLRFNDYDDIVTNLPKFIEYVYVKKRYPKFSWSDFTNQWINQEAVFVKYEDMRLYSIKELQRIVMALSKIELSINRATEIVDRYSFQKQAGRKCGEENKKSFMRKGIIEDWKNNFSDESKEIFKQVAGKELIKLGYEKDTNW